MYRERVVQNCHIVDQYGAFSATPRPFLDGNSIKAKEQTSLRSQGIDSKRLQPGGARGRGGVKSQLLSNNAASCSCASLASGRRFANVLRE